MSLDVLLLVAALAFVAWVSYRAIWKRHVDRRFGVRLQGSRDGYIHVRCDGFVAVAYYEVGGSVALILPGPYLRTLEGKGLSPEQRSEAIRRIREWSLARGTSVVIDDPAD